MMVRVHIFVSGMVQGVFFRLTTMRKALEIGVYGWVKNLRDGRVEIVCEGEKDKVNRLVEWCKKGPEGSFVTNTDISWEKYAGEFETFQIVYD